MSVIKRPLRRILAIRGIAQVLTVTVGLILLCIVFGIMNPIFFSSRNVANLLRQIAPILLIGIGQSYVLITGNIDLSIGSVVGMSTMISATLMTKGVAPFVAVLITIVCCLALGLSNGLLVSFAKLPPFIATLGTMTIARGIAQIANNNYNTDSIGEAAQGFRDLFYYGKTLGLYNTIWIAVLLWLIFNFLLTRTKSGRHIYAIGSNAEAARLSGVNLVSTTTKAYLVSAFVSCVVGLITTATSGVVWERWMQETATSCMPSLLRSSVAFRLLAVRACSLVRLLELPFGVFCKTVCNLPVLRWQSEISSSESS